MIEGVLAPASVICEGFYRSPEPLFGGSGPCGSLRPQLVGEVSQPHQVEGRRGEGEHPSDSFASAMLGLAQASDGLDPTEDLLDTFALSLAHRVALVPRGALINRAGAPLVLVLRHVRRRRIARNDATICCVS